MTKVATRALAALALIACALGAAAQSSVENEVRAAMQAAGKVAQMGPQDVKLVDQALLKLPAGLVYIPPAEAGRLLTAMGNRAGDNLLGLVLSPERESNWFVVMRFVKSGYIKDDDAKVWKVDELLDNIKNGTEQMNKERRSRGIAEVEVLGWVEAPKYDGASHRLVWSLQSREKGAPAAAERGINYNTYALGRDGYISMNLVTELNRIDAERPFAHQLLASLQYNDGKRYADFNSATDHVAEFGLAALVGGVAAKKLGLFALMFAFFAKFAKVIGVAAIGIGAAVAKALRGKKARAA
jgi:uncharacterized membrane-anchored protein